MRRGLLVVVALASAGCIAPVGPMERLNNSAYELNTATRFGRFDVALGLVERRVQPEFVRRHAGWGKRVRIVDLEVQSVMMTTPGQAEVKLEVSWHRLDSTTIRVSLINQRWKQGESAWLLEQERRESGDAGIFGRRKKKKADHGKTSVEALEGSLSSPPGAATES